MYYIVGRSTHSVDIKGQIQKCFTAVLHCPSVYAQNAREKKCSVQMGIPTSCSYQLVLSHAIKTSVYPISNRMIKYL